MPTSDKLAVRLMPSRPAIAGLVLTGVVSNLLMLVGPIFMLQVYDRVLPGRSVPTLIALSILACCLYGFYAFVEMMRARIAVRIGAIASDTIARHIFGATSRRDRRPGVPDPTRDLDSLRQFLSGAGPTALLDLPWLPFYLGIIWLMHPLLGMVTGGGALFIAILLAMSELSSRGLTQKSAALIARRQAHVEDARAGRDAIAAMGMLPAFERSWSQVSSELSRTMVRAADQTTFYSVAAKAFRFMLQSAVLGCGAYLVIQNASTPGSIIGASIISSRALAPVEQVVGQWRAFVAARQAVSRLRAALADRPRAAPVVTLPTPRATLSVEQLATGPGPKGPALVSQLSFSLAAGEALGVLGPSGSGKSSLGRALVGVWPAIRGSVRLDGSELHHFDPNALGRAIGYLPQTIELFDGSIAQNIGRFADGASSTAILAAAEAAGVHGFVSGLPNGYDTQIGERGLALSAGQRQRIALARALYGDPFLLVFDEPNSNLDGDGDAALGRSVTNAKQRGAIVIVVAHRPSAISAVDKLLYIQAGRQAAFGPRDEVLRRILQPTVSSRTTDDVVSLHG